jgi:hypothetical protein
MRLSLVRRLIGSLLILAALSGCRSRPIPVQGVVTLDGQPLESATVLFMPQDGAGRPASAFTDHDGSFSLTTFTAGDGALPGDYHVVVRKTLGRESEPPPIVPGDIESIKQHYPQRFTKKKGDEKKRLIPARYGNEAKTPLRITVPPEQPVVLELHDKT